MKAFKPLMKTCQCCKVLYPAKFIQPFRGKELIYVCADCGLLLQNRIYKRDHKSFQNLAADALLEKTRKWREVRGINWVDAVNLASQEGVPDE